MLQQFYYDIDRKSFVVRPGLGGGLEWMRIKRGDTLRLKISFVQGGQRVPAPDVIAASFLIRSEVGGAVLMLADDFEPDGDDLIADIGTNTVPLSEWLGDRKKADALAEFSYQTIDEVSSTWIFTAEIENDLIDNAGSDTPPTPYNELWLSNRAVRHDQAQTLSTEAAAQARENIGAPSLSDARFSDSREWTAQTITQTEAEAGTSTTRRAFTAQRVFQAIAAWWNASAFKAKLDGIANGATANQTDAFLLSRANHTGTQGWGTLSGTASKVPFTTTNGGPAALGELAWLAESETLCLRLKNGENLDVGEETIYHVENATGSTIAKGAAVSYAGTVGGSGKIRVKPWDGSTDAPEAFMGLAMGSIANNATGYVTSFGQVRGVNTSAFSDGVILYANPTGTGLTATKPTSTHVIAALCVNASNNGTLLVRPVVSQVATWDAVTGKPSTFTPSAHTHGNITNSGTIGTTADLVVTTTTGGALTVVSRSGIDSRTSFPNADVTAATSSATPNTLVKRDADGGVLLFGNEAPGAYIGSIQDTGAVIDSGQGIGVFATSVSGLYHAFFGNTGSDRAFIARVNGAFGWFRGIFTGSIQAAATLTANRTYILPDASGTLALASTQAQTFLNALPASIPSAILNLDSSTQALKIPSMTETQRNAIASPVAGLILYNTTTNRPNFHNGSAWVAL